MAKSERDRAREEARQRYDNQGAGGSNTIILPEGVEFYKIETGLNSLDVVPWTATVEHELEKPPVKAGVTWWRVRWLRHNSIGPNNEKVVCPRTVGRKCPICEERDNLFSQNLEDEAKALNASFRMLFLVQTERDEVKAVDISEWAFWKKLKADMGIAESKGEKDVFTFYWPEDGYTIEAWFEEASFGGGKYPSCTRVDFKKRDNLGRKILAVANAIQLDQCLNVLSYSDLQKKFLGMGDDTTDDQVDRTPPEAKPSMSNASVEEASEDEESLFKKVMALDTGISGRKIAAMGREELLKILAQFEGGRGAANKEEEAEESMSGKCPHGHKFGVDLDDTPDCGECDVWPKCDEEFDRRKTKGK